MLITGNDARVMKESIWKLYPVIKKEKDYLGLYIQIPFCKSKCNYCHYFSFAVDEGILDSDIDDLIEEIIILGKCLDGVEVANIAFGGGTPSLLTGKQLIKIFSAIEYNINITCDKSHEKTFEVHPAYLTQDLIDALISSPINRVSFGIQSLNDNVLKNENRKGTTVEKLSSMTKELKKGIDVVNCDLLAALSGQTAETIINDALTLSKIETIDQIFIYEWIHTLPQDRPSSEEQRKILTVVQNHLSSVLSDRFVLGGPINNKDNMIIRRKNKVISYAASYIPNPIDVFNNNVIGLTLGSNRLDGEYKETKRSYAASSFIQSANLMIAWSKDSLILSKIKKGNI